MDKIIKNNMFAWYEMFLTTTLWWPWTSLDMENSSNLVSKSKLFALVVIRLLCFVKYLKIYLRETL